MKHIRYSIILLLLLLAGRLAAQVSFGGAAKFNEGWLFALADDSLSAQPGFDDSRWRKLDLPHDWSIEGQLSPSLASCTGYLPGGIGWYRKHFRIEDAAPRHYIYFEGVYNRSEVYLNGHLLGKRPNGYISFLYDMTPYLKPDGENVLAVRVDHSRYADSRWYTGSGIYRHVWLITAGAVHVINDGTYVTTPRITEERADVRIVTSVTNASDKPHRIEVSQRILTSEGKAATKSLNSERLTVVPGDTTDIVQDITLSSPVLWSTDNPYLYTLETTVKSDGKKTDVYQTRFGVRSIAFTADKGFFLNGKQTKLKGVCLHEDAGSLGTAVPERSNERRLEILKEYGCNAIRCAHNQPSPEFLDLCDRMGFLVIDEAFDKWKSGYYAKYFDQWWQKDLANMLTRDRNHPSVILWSIGNELQEAWDDSTDTGVRRAQMLQDFVHKHEPSRMVILSAQNNHQERFAGVTDVIGYNYLEARMLSDHQKFPERRMMITEELPYFSGEEGNIRSYTPFNPWNIIAANEFVAGGFIWSGADYLGEAVGQSHGWPNGLFDICMFEKPRAAYHRAMWSDKPTVSIAFLDPSLDIDHGRDLWQWPKMASHWNLPESYIGQVIQVCTITNCESVEIFLNGKSMGKQNTADFPNNTIIWNIPYRPGVVTAKGYNGGKEAAAFRLETSLGTDSMTLTPDRSIIAADGQDVSHITVQLYDKNGKPVQTDDRELTVTVEGDGKFMGIDSGDLRRKRTFNTNRLKTYFGKALIVVQSLRKAGQMTVKVEMEGKYSPYTVRIQSE